MYYVVYVSFDFEVKVFDQVRWKSVVFCNHRVHLPFCWGREGGAGAGGEPPTKFSKRGGVGELTGSQL